MLERRPDSDALEDVPPEKTERSRRLLIGTRGKVVWAARHNPSLIEAVGENAGDRSGTDVTRPGVSDIQPVKHDESPIGPTTADHLPQVLVTAIIVVSTQLIHY